MSLIQCREQHLAAEAECAEASRRLQTAQQLLFKARVDLFVFNAFDPNTDKPMVKHLLMELADENSPFSVYVSRQQMLRPIIDAVVKLFDLKNVSQDNYIQQYKMPLADEENNLVYGINMMYQTGSASIEAKVIDY